MLDFLASESSLLILKLRFKLRNFTFDLKKFLRLIFWLRPHGPDDDRRKNFLHSFWTFRNSFAFDHDRGHRKIFERFNHVYLQKISIPKMETSRALATFGENAKGANFGRRDRNQFGGRIDRSRDFF